MTARRMGWGILGTADIARKNWLAILNSGNAVAAVASRDVKRARRFIEHCQSYAPMPALPRAFGSYNELLECPDVEAVYIPLPTGLRKEWVLRAAVAGKHVLCEKPCAVSVANLREMIEACKKARVQFMDGVMFMHSRRLPRLRELLDDVQSVGEVKRITSAFSFYGGPDFLTSNIRGNARLEPYGCLGDLGWYCIRLALWAVQWNMPDQVIGRVLSERKHPESAQAIPA